jgi:hypothetical protein
MKLIYDINVIKDYIGQDIWWNWATEAEWENLGNTNPVCTNTTWVLKRTDQGMCRTSEWWMHVITTMHRVCILQFFLIYIAHWPFRADINLYFESE